MVRFEKMTKRDFNDYLPNAIAKYAKEKAKAGTWLEKEAHKLSKESFETLLPNGVNTENHYLFSIIEPRKEIKIGYLWFQCSESLVAKTAFINDFYIFEEFRDKGYGTQSMEALDAVVRKLQINKITLHVFSHNKRAIALYKKIGFEDTDLIMAKYIR
ncbi:GNAT family N-acetyltransferase [Desulfosporosinus sp. SB140]|uniref:GNAT family N-acetyltransferase n=1 Tax=Desulfosporosinus paludis TaxID=3115649 RepID=UPI00388EAEF3